jgi:SET domain-containing protein
MDKSEFLESLKGVYCRLAPTEHGVGVIAIRPIPKGTDPFPDIEKGGAIPIPKAEWEATFMDEAVRKLVENMSVYQNGALMVPDCSLNAIDPSFFLNHSENPNMITRDGGETFIAARDIARGEELTADYTTYNDETGI